MNEVMVGLFGLLGLLNAAISAFFCMLGGRSITELEKVGLAWFGSKSNRVWGRWTAPIFFSTGNVLLSLVGGFNWLVLVPILTYWGVSRLGYGGVASTIEKVIRRSIWSILFTAACIPYVIMNFGTPALVIYISQVLVGLVVAVSWGVKNPVLSPLEELVIKFCNLVLVPFLVLLKF